MKTFTKMLKELTKHIESDEFKERNVTNTKNFTRNRKLTFPDLIKFTIGFKKTNLDTEISSYIKATHKEKFTREAFSKSRIGVSPNAFKELISKSYEVFDASQTLPGTDLRVIAIDGSTGQLPKTRDLMKSYEPQGNCLHPEFHAVFAYDALNNLYLDALFTKRKSSERTAAIELIKDIPDPEHKLFIFDRGFPSRDLIKLLNEKHAFYIMRVSTMFLREINSFWRSKVNDAIIKIDTAPETKTDIRCTKVQLSNGVIEMLISDMPMKTFSPSQLKDMYKMRWQIETSFNYLKHEIRIEDFCARTENAIKQEFYASLVLFNIEKTLEKEAVELLPDKDKKKQIQNMQ